MRTMRIQWAIFGPKVSVWHHRRQNVFYAFWDRANLDFQKTTWRFELSNNKKKIHRIGVLMAFFKLIGLFVPKMCKITTNPETAAYFWDKKYNSKIQIRHLDFNKKDSYNKMISEIGSKDLIKCDLINADTQ